jgi:SAM-dependent methyltransferase
MGYLVPPVPSTMTNRARADYHRAAQCYSDLSPYYHDWSALPWVRNMQRQADELAWLLPSLGYPPPARVLDFTAGMGTQPIGLALKGYRPTALDLSPVQIDRAWREAAQQGVEHLIEWIVGDALEASRLVDGPFDVALSFGNSLPLLGSRENILAALREIAKNLRPGGTLLLSVADYSDLLRTRPSVIQSGRVDNADRKGAWLETAQWLDGARQYISDVYFIYTEPAQCVRHYSFAALYALTDDDLADLLHEAGFVDHARYSKDRVPAFSCPLHKARLP